MNAAASGANIDLGPTPTSALDQAINYSIVHHSGNVITNSWGSFEGLRNTVLAPQRETSPAKPRCADSHMTGSPP
jgi:hypothetical protein